MSKNECYGCTRRKVGCHSDCPDYARFVKRNNERKAARDRDVVYRGYRMGVLDKILTDGAMRRQKKDRARRKR